MTNYCSESDVADWLNISDNIDDPKIALAVTSSCRWIDRYCQVPDGMFGVATDPVARTFVPCDLLTLNLGVYTIGDPTGLVLQTDAGGDGTFETTWSAGDYELLPSNAAADGMPYTSIRAVGTRTFPWLVNTWLTRLDRVKVTGLYGWPAVPEQVQLAAVIQAARLFARRKSADGIAGGQDFALRVSSRVDPDVEALLKDFRKSPVLVA